MASKLTIILLVVSLTIMLPTLIFTVLVAQRLNNQDAYNKTDEENNSMDKNFMWILVGLMLSFLLLCVAVFMYISETKTVGTNTNRSPQVASIAQ